MARKLLWVLTVLALICKLLGQATVQQYLQLSGLLNPAQGITIIPVPQRSASTPKSPVPIAPTPKPPKPVTGLSTIPGLSIPSLSLESPKTISNDKSLGENCIDSTLLNNLAIALQLLIVSNILNMPSEVKENIPLVAELANKKPPCYRQIELDTPSVPYLQNYVELPNQKVHYQPSYMEVPSQNGHYQANYVELPSQNGLYQPSFVEVPSQNGHYQPSFVEVPSQNPSNYYQQQDQVLPNPNYLAGTVYKETQPSKTRIIKSPYDALSSSLYADSISSQFETENLKRDFKSPYAMLTDNSDVFNINDLF